MLFRMENCVFCKIVQGELPAHTVYEDEHFLAFLDIRPLSPGHTLVIPKQHYRWVWDIPKNKQEGPNIGSYFFIVQKIAKALQHAFDTEMIESKIIGDEVPHAHVWLYPNPESSGENGDKKSFEENAEKVRSSLRTI